MIILEKVDKAYLPHGLTEPVVALDNVSLTVEPGEIFGVIGKSGAGKSTLLRCVNALEQPDNGKIIVDGSEIHRLSHEKLRAKRQQIGMIFQHFYLLSTQTVFDNVALPLYLQSESKPHIRQTVMDLLTLVGLDDKADVYPEQLSGGQKQRVAIARAMVHRPHVLLCDEATSALDPQTTITILELLNKIRKQMNLTILLITHDMNVIKYLCDRVAILDKGQLIEMAPVLNFFQKPQSKIGQEFIQSILKHDVPELLKKHVSLTPAPAHSPLWRIWFTGHATVEPLIIEMYKKFGISCNILQANVEWIHAMPTGIMITAIDGEASAINACWQYLNEHNITTEILGYVHRDAFIIN